VGRFQQGAGCETSSKSDWTIFVVVRFPFFFDGITLSTKATTDSITIEEEATTYINRNGTVATTKRGILKKSRCGAR
jgi:hypothetical protein